MAQKKVYDKEFRVQAVKLGREIGFSKAAKELGINVDTLYGWSKARTGYSHSKPAMSLTEEVQKLRQQNRSLEKEENEFLAEESAFFPEGRQTLCFSHF